MLMARGAAGCLDERGVAAEEAFLVGVEDADETDFRKVEPLTQEIDPYEDVELGGSECAEDFDAFDRIDVTV